MQEQKATKPKEGPIRQGEIGRVPYSPAAARRWKEQGWIAQGEIGRVPPRKRKQATRNRRGGR
jgi:hypothetical protein